MDLVQLGVRAVEENLVAYYQVPRMLAKRYAAVLVARWIGWKIDEMDAATLSEDLYQETDDWETPDYMPENVKDFIKGGIPFPNLDYSESESKKQFEAEIERAKKF